MVLAGDSGVGNLPGVVRVGVVCASVSPRVDCTARLRAIEIAVECGSFDRTECAVALKDGC